MRSWLPPDHLAFQVTGVVGQLDLAGFEAAYRADRQGQPPYDPAMMVGLLFYCYFKGIRSLRKIAGACIDDVGCRVICGGASPSHQAVATFIRRHRPEIRRLFVQVLSLLAAEGAVQGYTAAVDGSPVSGNASRFANLTGEQLADRIAAVQAAIDAEAEAWLAGVDGADSQPPLPGGDGDDDEDPPPGGGGPGGGVPRRLAALAAKLARLRAAQDKLAERQAVPGGPGRPGHRRPGRGGPGGRAAGGGRGGPGRQDGQVPGRGGGGEGLAVRQEAGPRRAGSAGGRGPHEPGHRAGPAGRRPAGRRGLASEGLGHRSGLPAAAGQERRRLDPGLEPAAGRGPPGRSCWPPSCTTTPPTPAPWPR